jgi:hypothetical protein
VNRLVLAGALVVAGVAGAEAQISPGPLSRFHQSLEGARNCSSCHGPKGVTRELCLTCHTALARRIDARRGLHAREEYRVGCERCHVEHQGRGFELVFWGKAGRAGFDHAHTGFPLQGRHAALGCESCHGPRRIRDRSGLANGGVNLARTFLGLVAACSSCHADPHKDQFAPRGCTDCHEQDRWKPPARFDHGQTAFPLTGAHEHAACASCHKPRAEGAARFKGTPHQSCASCHRDPHAGRMGPTCATCHSTAAWSRIDAGRFDHGKTRFPLTGRHEKVACADCHTRGPGGMKFQGTSFASCASCHEDPHAGRLGANCAGCHTTADFDRIQPGQFDHSRTGYPLEGKHADAECDSCHRPGRPGPLRHARCTDCHEDRHMGQLAGRADGGRCESCHDVGGFQPPRFSVEDHARTRMPLAGAHLAVACDACHREVPLERLQAIGVRPPAASPPRTEQLRFASTACSECHADPHRGRTGRYGRCESCHLPEAWAAVRFDHARAGFPLAGRHAQVPCRSCHPGEGGALAFTARAKVCDGCHRDPHEGQFARRFGKDGRTDCAACHDPASWQTMRFDHDRETSFPLEGAHRAVPCVQCHLREIDGRRIMKFTGLGRACSACHAADVGKPSR